MGNRPTKNYDYTRAGVAMVTLKTRPGIWLCRITPDSFTLTDVGHVVQQALGEIHSFYEQVKIGQYQIMPDHLHAMVHVVGNLPTGVTLQRVIRGFKIGVDRTCRDQFDKSSFQVFEKGMHDSLVFDREQLQREVAYIRDNVRRYRLRKAHPDLFQSPCRLSTLSDGVSLWGIGNCSLLDHPRRVQVQFSRRNTEEQWKNLQKDLTWYLDQGYVLVSAFISPHEKRALCEAAAHGGRIIRLTHEYFCARYKPAGKLFDLCCAGRLLEVSVAGAFARNARLDRMVCLRLNAVARELATAEW